MTLLEDPSAPTAVAEHASSDGLLARIGRAAGRRRRRVLALWAIITMVAFGVTGPIPPTELGVTLALAVLLDATIIRMMLVPSLLGMLGEKAWYVPAWLDRRLPQIDFSH